MLDQGLTAAGNFVAAFLLARYVSKEEFGAFVIVYAIGNLLLGINHSLVYTPASLYGSKAPHEVLRSYDRAVVLSLLVFSLLFFVVGLIIAATGVALDGGVLFTVAAWYVVPLFFRSLMEGARRLLVIKGVPNLAFVTSCVRLMVILLGAGLLIREQAFTIPTMLAVLGLSSALSALYGLWVLRYHLGRQPGGSIREALKKNVIYGRWILGFQALISLSQQAHSYITGSLLGLAAVGAIGAFLQLFGPLNIYSFSIQSFVIPEVSRKGSVREAGGLAYLRKLYLVLGVVPLLYLGIIAVAGEPLVDWLFKGKYTEYADCLYIFCIVYAINYLTAYKITLATLLEIPHKLIWAAGYKLLGFVLLGVPAVLLWNVFGAALMTLGGDSLYLAYYLVKVREPKTLQGAKDE